MNDKIKKQLQEYAKKNGWSCETDEDLAEILLEEKVVYYEIKSSHRWYDKKFVVVNIDGMLVGYDYYHITGDTSISDMDLELNLNSICEVEEKEKTIKYYTPIK
jgi:hypothetical protein